MTTVSLFDGMMSKVPIQGSLEAVVQTIREDPKLATITQSYRVTHSKSFKAESPLFAVACLFEGGKGMQNIKALTGLSLVDFDHIVESEERRVKSEERRVKSEESPALMINKLKAKIIADPHTMMCYTTISGNGLRVIYKYELPNPNPSLYHSAFFAGNAHYEQLLGIKADPQCKNINRLSGLAHDPDVYFNPNAIAFKAEEIKNLSSWEAKESKRKKKIDRIAEYYETFIKPKLEHDGAIYEPGKHNDYVMRVGYMLANKRYSKAEATEWAVRQFPEYDGVQQVFKSCFDNAPHHKESNNYRGAVNERKFATVDEIVAFLDTHIQLRYNIITTRYEYLGKNGKWLILLDRNVNSIWKQMSSTLRVMKADIINVIESDYTPGFHPFKHYLDSIPPDVLNEQTDHIKVLSQTVRVRGGEEEQELWYQYLKKWLVGMIAGWIDEDAVNNVILVFIGEQGAYKTTWFNKLLPPELRQYFHTKTNAKRLTKDDLIALSQFGLTCCEELDEMTPSEMNQLKAAVTMSYVNERAAYAHYTEQRKHIVTFCGTGNNPQFLNDPTGTRRWLPFEIESILSPYEHPFNYAGIFAQAYALYKSGFRYWFTKEEILEQNRHNLQFETPRLEQELVDLYFRKPTEGENGEFVSVARALQLISVNMSQKLNTMKIGKAFKELGFKESRTKHSRGYIAVIRTAEDIKAYQTTLALRTE